MHDTLRAGWEGDPYMSSHQLYEYEEKTICRKCEKEFDFVPIDRGMKSNYVCIECKRQKSKKITKGYHGLSDKQFSDMLLAQNGCCAICKKRSSSVLCVDHCHTTGKIRGLLCKQCNVGLGAFKDNTLALAAAVHYLQRDHRLSPIHAAFTKGTLRQVSD